MNPYTPAPRKFITSRAAITVATAALLSLVGQAYADSDTWSATPADGNWSNALNWVGGIAPGATTGTTNADLATFNTGSTTTAIVVDAGRNIRDITFATTANTYTLGSVAGNTLLLSSGGTIQSTGSSGSQNINAPLQIQGNNATYTFRTDTPGGSRVMIFGGAISGTSTAGNTTTLTLEGSSTTINALNGAVTDGAGGGKLAVVKNGTGLWAIGAGTFSGGVTVNAGSLRTGSSGNTTASLGSGSITLNGGGLILGSTNSTTLNNDLVVGASGGSVTFRSNHGFNPNTLTGTGTLTFGHSNSAGTVITTTNLRDFAGSFVLNPNGANSTTLRFGTGAVQTSAQNAAITLNNLTGISQQAGTNSTITTKIGTLSGVAGSNVGGSGAGGGTFVYDVGHRNENSVFAGTIANGGTKTGLIKSGTGIFTVSGTNTYTGGTTVSVGTLLAGSASALGTGDVLVNGGKLASNIANVGGLGAVTVSSGTLDLNDAATGSITLANNKNFTLSGGTWSVSFNNTVSYDQIIGGGTGIFSLADATVALGGTIDYTASYSLLTGFSSGSIGALTFTGYDSVNYIADISDAGVLSFELVAIPEPSAFAAIAGVLGLGCATLRRRRRA